MASFLVALVGSALLGAIATNWQKNRQRRKEKIAGAMSCALRRVEMYYRILRRRETGEDDMTLRDLFHKIQEESAYFTSLLQIESPWLGYSYECFLKSLGASTEQLLKKAWTDKPYGPRGELKDVEHPNVKKYIKQFNEDSRRFFNPPMRGWMRFKYWLRKYVKDDGYGLKQL